MTHSRLVLTMLVVVLSRPGMQAADDVDDYVEAQMKQQRMPGLALAVAKEGTILLAKGYGLANVEHKVPVKPETIFQSGSVGKQFTATAVMMLVEEGKLALDDKISKYLDNTPDLWKDITVRHLLTHTSGIKNYSPKDLNFRQDYTEEELVKKAASFPLDFPPGEKWRYSNTGYVLLGVVIRKASGEFYGDLLRNRVFLPLGMETARIINEADIIPNRAAGYRLVKGELKNQEWVSPSLNTTADGSLYLTVLDMVKWDAALYTEKLLKRTSLEQMWTPVKTTDGKSHPYGFGWQVHEAGGHKIIEHGGAWQGFMSAIVRYADDRLTVIVLTNLAAQRVNPGKIAKGVAALYLPAPKSTTRVQSANSLEQLALAMHKYHSTHGKFPPVAVYDKNGKALLSWRVMLLPYLEQEALYKEFKLDEPWDSEHNKQLLARMPKLFEAIKTRDSKDKDKYLTHYQGFVGAQAIFDGTQGINMKEITDGMSNTIMFVEARKGVPWSKPEDIPFEGDRLVSKIGGMQPEGFNVAFCDGRVEFLRNTIKEQTLHSLITRNGGEVLPEDFDK